MHHNAGHASSGIDHSSRPLPRQPYQSVSTPVSHTPTTAAVTQNPALVRRQHMPTAALPVTSQLSQPIRKQEEDISSQLQNLEMGADNLSGTRLLISLVFNPNMQFSHTVFVGWLNDIQT